MIINKPLPDKRVRKDIVDALVSLEYNSTPVRVYDNRVPGNAGNEPYVLIGIQQSPVINGNKCFRWYDHSTRIEIVVKQQKTGNVPGRLAADDIAENVRTLLQAHNFALGDGLRTDLFSLTFLSDVVTQGLNFTLYRKILELRLKVT